MARILFTVTFLSAFLGGLISDAAAEIPARLRRIDIRPHVSYTRLLFQLDRETSHSVTELPGQRVRVTFFNSDGPLFRKLRGYTDQHVNGITIAQRGDLLQVTVSLKSPAEGVRVVDGGTQVLALDVGPSFKGERKQAPVLKGRESIAAGAGRFVRDYDPPLRSDLSFVPTDQQSLRGLLNIQDARLFLLGEAALYKGHAPEAISLFEPFLKSDSKIWALAAYRCGEAYYAIQDYRRALQLFRDAERLWPQFLSSSPAVVFCYADSLVRCGDLPAGRRILAALIASQAEKKTAPTLLIRLADILDHQQKEAEARLIYQNVVKYFPDNKAASYAALKLADRRFPTVDANDYSDLRDVYRGIAKTSSDFIVREEALFKSALIEALYGPSIEALQTVSTYERRYPSGVFVAIARSMHEELMPAVYHDIMAAHDNAALIKMAEGNLPYLSRCMAEPAFLKDLDMAYTGLGLLQEEVKCFGRLAKREWASPYASFLYGRMLDTTIAVADWSKAEATGREFLRRFPHLPEVQRVREIMGDISYRKGDMAGVRDDLAWLLQDEKVRAVISDSYYYLGKALEEAGQSKRAGRAMELFLSNIQEKKVSSPLVADAHFTVGMSELAAGKAGKALVTFRSGLSEAPPEGRDRFLYRIGELNLREGRVAEARNSWGKIVKEGSDPVWQKLATQAVSDLEWRERTGSKI